MQKYYKWIKIALIAVVALAALNVAFKWGFERVFVGPDEALMVTNKFGKPLPPDMIVVPKGEDGFKGVQEELLGPGRYFLNPVAYDTKVVPLTQISAGEPQKWEWDLSGKLKDPNTAPKIGLVALKQGANPPAGMEVVDAGYKGIQKEVLTPGTYKLNPQKYEVKLEDAVVVPPGFVGVVTRLTGNVLEVPMATLSQIRASASGPATAPAAEAVAAPAPSRLVVGQKQRGILKEVLQPGIYYLNPKLAKVTIIGIGYDAISLDHNDRLGNTSIKFYTSDGYQVEADFTVVWGRDPSDAPHIVANIGGQREVEENVIKPAMKAACQNEGAKYSAKGLIQGSTRSEFQDALSKALENQVKTRNIHVLLALVRNITIKDGRTGQDVSDGLLATIQRANIEKEKDLTNQQKTETASVKAQLDTELKLVDVAKETVAAETKVKEANLLAEGQKKAAEIDAKRELDVSTIELQIATLEAERTEMLGKANAEVERLKNEAEAKGAKLLVDAFGSPQAYNLYIFAKNFEPKDLRLIFAGQGTFWTDLKGFQDVAATKVLQGATERK